MLAAKLLALEEEYLREVPPDSTSYLEQFRGTVLRFHLAGHSKKSTFEFLTTRQLIRCSQAAFYRWLTKNVDFKREATELLGRRTAGSDEGIAAVSHAKPFGGTGASHEHQASKEASPISHAKPADAGSADPVASAESAQRTPVDLPIRSTFLITHSSSECLQSSAAERAKRLQALDDVLADVAANDKEAMTTRALSRLESRDEQSSDP